MLINKSKEMTFSPYNSVSKKQQGSLISQRKISQEQNSEDNLEQLTPDDLFMDYSHLQIKQQKKYQDEVDMNNFHSQNQYYGDDRNDNIINLYQNSMNIHQNSLQNQNNNSSLQWPQNSSNNQHILSNQQQLSQFQQVNNDTNNQSNSESYILNSSKFINNNLSSIIGNQSSIVNDNSHFISFTLKQENNRSQESNQINVYNNFNNNQKQNESQQGNQYTQSCQNYVNKYSNEYTRQSLKEQISQRLEGSNNNLKYNNFYKKLINQSSQPQDNQILNDYQQLQNQQQVQQLKANSIQNPKQHPTIPKTIKQNKSQDRKILNRRASMNDQSSMVSQRQNLSYQSLFTQRQNSLKSQSNQGFHGNKQINNSFQNEQNNNDFSKMNNLQLDQINSNQASMIKKQLLFSMIVETPDARQEVINVFDDDQISKLAQDFCIKNQMNLSRYCNFIIDRLKEALDHYNSFQTPKNKQFNQQQNSNAPKFINSQESAVFQVTQKGITQQVSSDSNIINFCSNPSLQNIDNQNNHSNLLENGTLKSQQSENLDLINGSVSEQVFELPYKSLIYELKLSDMIDESNLQNDQIVNQIPNIQPNKYEDNSQQSENYIQSKVDPNSAAIMITLNPIENMTQKLNEQINVKNIFEDQIQSQYQNIEQLKQSIQKSLAQQQNIQQEFNRRRSNYSLQYESNKVYNSIEKSTLQKSINCESPNVNNQNQQNQNENEYTSNHFNRYDILKYQESQESARKSKQFQFNQKASSSVEKNQSNQKEQGILSAKYSVKIISPLDEMKYNDVNEFTNKQSENQSQLENQSSNLKLAAHLNVKNSSFYSPTSTNSIDLKNQKENKEHNAFFFGLNSEREQMNIFNNQNKKHDLKSDLIQAQNLLANQDVKVQKQNMSSLASQFDDFKNQDTHSLKSDLDKICSNQDIQKQQLHATNNKNYNTSQQNKDISNIFDGITNYSSIQKDKQTINTESLRIFDEKQQEVLPGLYKVCQTRIEEEGVGQQIKEQVETFNTNNPFNQFNFENFDSYDQHIKNPYQVRNVYNQSPLNIQQNYDNADISQQNQNHPISQQQINKSIQININQHQLDNNLRDINQQSTSRYQDNLQQNSQQKIQQGSFNENSQKQIQYYNSVSNKKCQYQLPPLSSNGKVHSYNNNINQSNKSTNQYSQMNQNLSSVKKNLFNDNNSQKSLNPKQVQQKQKFQQYQNENLSFAQSNLSTARGSSCLSSKYDSYQAQLKTPSKQNQSINIFTARASENQTQRAFDSIQIQQSTPISISQKQQKINNGDKSENFNQIKQNIFNSIMKSNPSKFQTDVKEVKLNISPFIEQNKLNQQFQGPYSEMYQKQLFKPSQQQIQKDQILKQNLFKSGLSQQNSIQKLRNNSLVNNQQLNNNIKTNNQQNKLQKRSSSFNLGRQRQSSIDYSIQQKQTQNNNSSLNKIKQNQQEIQTLNQEINKNLNEKFNFNVNFKQRIFQIFSALDSDDDGFISSDKIDIKSVNDLVLFIITPLLIEIICMNRSVNIEEFSCAFLKLFFNLPKQQQQIIIDQNVEINWLGDDGSLQNLEFFNFNSPLFQQYIDKKNTIQKASNKDHNWMLDLTNKEFLEFYVSNFKSLVNETNKYLI